MATRKSRTQKPAASNETVKKETPVVTKPKEVDFEKVRSVLTTVGLKSGESADDKLSLIAIKFYQRMNKLPITGKLDNKTLEKMGL